MEVLKQNHFLVNLLFIFAVFSNLGVWAINRCSHGLNFRQLCPNPMFVSSGGGSIPDVDVTINLKSNGVQSSSCKFFKDVDEVSAIYGIHVSEEPWEFNHASNCNNFIKLVVDSELEEDEQGYQNSNRIVCNQNLGMKVHGDVYLWHNYTVSSHRISFEDLITNYGHSSSDLNCTHRPKFVLVLFLLSRFSKCSFMIQQYRISDGNSGCDIVRNYPSSYRFCGAYPCSHEKTLLQELKLVARRIPPIVGPHQSKQVLIPYPLSSAEVSEDVIHNSNTQDVGHVHKPHSSNPFDPKNIVPPPGQPTISSGIASGDNLSTPSPNEGVGGNSKPIDWNEWIVRMFFPGLGLAFIFVSLSILRGRYAEDICGRVPGKHVQYQNSTISLEKSGLPL